VTARASDSMFYPLTMCALEIVFMNMIITVNVTVISSSAITVFYICHIFVIWKCNSEELSLLLGLTESQQQDDPEPDDTQPLIGRPDGHEPYDKPLIGRPDGHELHSKKGNEDSA